MFVYTFARYDLAHRNASHEDFDIASAGLAKVLEGPLWSALPRYAVGAQSRILSRPRLLTID